MNVHYEELTLRLSRDQLLTNQLQRLLVCFDVYLETEADTAATDGPLEFGKDKVYPRVTRCVQSKTPAVIAFKIPIGWLVCQCFIFRSIFTNSE